MKEEKNKTQGACTRLTLKQRFSAKRLALMGVFVALSFVASIFTIPLFPGTPVAFLTLEFGNVFILLIAFLLGPVEGVIVCVIKELLHYLFLSDTAGVGEIANILVTSTYILLPSILYQYRKGLKSVALSLLGACVIATFVALFFNRFIMLPFQLNWNFAVAKQFFWNNLWYFVLYNVLKTTSVGILTFLLYKRLSNFLKKLKI